MAKELRCAAYIECTAKEPETVEKVVRKAAEIVLEAERAAMARTEKMAKKELKAEAKEAKKEAKKKAKESKESK